MNSKLVILCLLTFISLNCTSQLTGIKAYYQLDGDGTDASGNGYDGTVTGASATTNRFGQTKSAIHFSGGSQNIDITTSDFELSEYTYSLWVYLDNLSSDYSLISIGGDGADQSLLFAAPNIWNNISYYNIGSPYGISVTSPAPKKNTWFHLAMVRSQDSFLLYINGKLQSATYTSGNSPYYSSTNYHCYLGARHNNSLNLQGRLDDVIIFDHALDFMEVQQAYSFSGPIQNLSYISQNKFCADSLIQIGFGSSGYIDTANSFTIQLSDNTGSFSNPYTLAYYKGQNSDTFTTHLPFSTMAPGSGYKIRLVSTHPAKINVYSDSLSVKITSHIYRNLSACFGKSASFNGKTYSSSGTYLDSLKTQYGCDSILHLNVTIDPPLTSSFTKNICGGTSFIYYGKTYSVTGVYLDTISSVAGCDSFVTINLNVDAPVFSNVYKSICYGNSYVFFGTTCTSTGSYSYKLVNFKGCDSTVILNLTVLPKINPQVSLTGRDTLRSTGTFVSYKWLLNGNSINGAFAKEYIAQQNGTYRLIVTDSNGCTDTSAIINVLGIGITTVIPDLKKLEVYPNPVNTELTITINDPEPLQIYISDVTGRVVYSKILVSVQNKIDLSSISPGAYILLAENKGCEIPAQKIIKY